MKDAFRCQTAVDVAELAAYLQQLAQSLTQGQLPVTGGDYSFNLRPIGLIDFNLKVRQRNGRSKVSLELAWADEETLSGEERERP